MRPLRGDCDTGDDGLVRDSARVLSFGAGRWWMVVARSARSRGLPRGLPLKAALFNEGGLAALWPWILANPQTVENPSKINGGGQRRPPT